MQLRLGLVGLMAIIAGLVVATPTPVGAAGCTATWLGGVGSWDSAGLWSPPSVPDADDDVCIAVAGSLVRLNHSAQVRSLVVGGGSGAQRTLRLSHGAADTTLTVTSSTTITSTGTLALAGDGASANTLLRSQGTGLANAGRVFVDPSASGTLQVAGDVTNTGTLDVQNNLSYVEGTFLNRGLVSVSGDFFSILPHVGSPTTFTNDVGGSMVIGPSDAGVRIDGDVFNQGAGTTSGPPAVIRGGVLNFSGSGTANFLVEGHAVLTGTMVAGQRVTGRTTPATGNVSLTLAADVTAGGALVLDSTAGATGNVLIDTNGHTLTNSGILQVAGPDGTRQFNGDLVNTGTVGIDYDLAYLGGGTLTNGGVIDIAVGRLLNLSGGSLYHQQADGLLRLGLGGPTALARIQSDAAVTLGGTLETTTNFSPSAGDSFTVVTGSSVSGTFSDTVFNGRTYQVNYGPATVALVANPPVGGVGGFANTAPVNGQFVSPAVSRAGPAIPYPSTVEVFGLDGVTTDVNVTLCGFRATFPSDSDFLLVSPTGAQALILSDAGGNGNDSPADPGSDVPINDVTVTLDDQAAATPNSGPTLVAGTFRPMDDDNEMDDYGTFATPNTDYFPPPSPPLGTNVALSVFNGANPNGAWNLYMVDDYPSIFFDEPVYPTLGCGWSLDVSTSSGGDAATSIGVFRPATGTWFVEGDPDVVWGASGDLAVPGDYDGNGSSDVAVYRRSSGQWFIRGGTPESTPWGAPSDVPVPGDYDGDGSTDIAVFRPSTGIWYVQGGPTAAWGASGDVPVPGDYDGDGSTDIAVFRPSTGVWHVQGGATTGWGASGDLPVPADYDGNGTADIAVFRPSTGVWYVQGGATTGWGASGDIPVPADYDGNGTADIAVFRPATGTWFVQGGVTTGWGTSGDIPIPLPPPLQHLLFPT